MEKFDDILKNRDFYDRKVSMLYADLERAKMNNAEREKLIAERDELVELQSEMEQYLRDTKRLISSIETEDRAFKKRRSEYLNAIITASLQEIFPNDELCAKLNYNFDRKSDVSLELLDADLNELFPDICSGKLQQYLISFAAVAGIANGLGVKNLYIDEAFGVAAPAILGEIGKVVQKRVEQGMQILVIAQNPGLYQDLPRREIKLQKDPVRKRVEVVSETDF